MEGITYSAKAKKNKADKNDPPEASRVNGTEAAAASSPPPPGLSSPSSDAVPAAPAAQAAPAALTAATALGLHIAPVTFAWGLHAYLLTRAAATRLVDSLPVSAPADIFVGSFLAATDSGRPMLAGRAVLPALATTAGAAGVEEGGSAGPGVAVGDLGDVVSPATRRAGVAHGVWSAESGGPPGRGKGAGGRRGGRKS